MSIIYNIPRTDGATEDDYNRQVYADGAIKQPGWLTDEELAAKFPPPPPVPPTLEEQQAAFTDAIQAHLDAFAQTRGYDGIMSAATYATSTVPKFRAEGQYAVAARDAVWATGYAILDDVLAGERVMPTIEEVIAELPLLEWPGV